MKELKATPGPWETDGPWFTVESEDSIYYVGPEGKVSDFVVARCTEECGEGDAESNAHLIAAAPDMYRALEDIARGPLQEPDFAKHAVTTAKIALAKARGES